jgi:integrase
MSTLVITTRRTKSGARYVVRYRLGGRGWPVAHAGSFRTLKQARARRDLVAGELAAGRNPADTLRALVATPAPTLSVEGWSERFIASRIDVDSNTTKNYRTALRKAGETFGARDPATITVDEVAAWVAALANKHKAGTVGLYLLTFRLLLDFAGVDPNPARDPRVRKPKQVREEPNPPTGEQVDQVLGAIGSKWRLLFITIEQGALRLGEAVSLRWQDVDAANLRLRLPRSATKRDSAVGLATGVARRSDRADMPARGSRAGTSSVPRHHGSVGVPGAHAGLQDSASGALPSARPTAPQDHDLASVRRPGTRACRASRARATVHVARRLLARHAAGRTRAGPTCRVGRCVARLLQLIPEKEKGKCLPGSTKRPTCSSPTTRFECERS